MASEAYVPGWAVSIESLLSEDTSTQEWFYRAHPLATMKFLADQSGAHMADDLRYAVAQTSALMVATTDRVCRHGINKTQLKSLQDVVAS